MTGRIVPFPPPTVEDLALDERSLDLVHAAWEGLDDSRRAWFNEYLVGAMVTMLPVDEVAAAVRVATSCSERRARRG